MERPNYLVALDDHFMSQYSDYAKICAIEGYRMPEILYIAPDGNVARRDAIHMRLCYQEEKELLLARFKEGLTDTDFTFSFSFRSFSDAVGDLFRKHTFKKLLPAVLARCGETAESAGEKLSVEPRFWRKIVKGQLYPEKNLLLALALVCNMDVKDAGDLLSVCGFAFDDTSVRDVVTEYLLIRKISNADMRDACLAEYKIVNLPIARHGAAQRPIQ